MQQFSARQLSAPGRVCLCLAAASLLLAGCRKEEISTFSVPKDTGAVGTAKAPVSSGTHMRWTTPAGWQEQPASGMRAGSFVVSKGDQTAEVSIIPLGGISGGELDNVNRWRNQVALGPIGEADLKTAAENVTIGSTPARLYDMAGSDPQSKQPARILAAILSGEGTTWFFKMTGPDAVVSEQKPAFKELLKSVRFEAGMPGHPPTPDTVMPPLPEGHPPLPTAPQQTGAPQAATGSAVDHGSASDKPHWEVPSGWQEQPPTSMRVATFVVTSDDGAKAEVSVIKLAGEAGGMLGNVNRWRSQIGLEPVDEPGLAQLVTTRASGGVEVTFVDMAGRSVESGDPARLVAATAPRGRSTWFYKILGDEQLVAKQKDAFVKFVESARYPHAS